MNIKRLTTILAIATMSSVLLAGCGKDASSNASGGDTITLGYQVNAGQTTQYVAEVEGFFKKNDLTVKRVEFGNPASMVAALQRGEIDMVSSQPASMLAARANGADYVAFLQNEAAKSTSPDSGTVLVPKSSTVNTLTDLAGKKVGEYLGVSSQLNQDVYGLLRQKGMDPSKVTWVDAPFSSHLDMLSSGQVEAVVTIDPYSTQILQTGKYRVVSYPYVEANPGQPLAAWWAAPEWLSAHTTEVTKFQNAMKEAIDWLHSSDSNARNSVADFTGLDVALLAHMPIINWSYDVDKAAWKKYIDICVQEKAIPSEQALGDVWDPTMVQFVKSSASSEGS